MKRLNLLGFTIPFDDAIHLFMKDRLGRHEVPKPVNTLEQSILNKLIISICGLFLFISLAVAEPVQKMPMPPRFSPDAGSEKTLESYPLGVITRITAFAHHGHSDSTVTLPNGMEGWVYEVHTVGDLKTYVQPSGSNIHINETADHPAMATYTLVFDSKGTVVDVLYAAADGSGLKSALLIQRSRKGDKPRAPWVPGKDE